MLLFTHNVLEICRGRNPFQSYKELLKSRPHYSEKSFDKLFFNFLMSFHQGLDSRSESFSIFILILFTPDYDY